MTEKLSRLGKAASLRATSGSKAISASMNQSSAREKRFGVVTVRTNQSAVAAALSGSSTTAILFNAGSCGHQ